MNGEEGGAIDTSEQDDEQMGTLLFSRLRPTKYISDSHPKDGIIMTEFAHAIEPYKTLITSKDGIEPLVSHKPSDTKSKDSTLPTCSWSPDEKGTIFCHSPSNPVTLRTRLTFYLLQGIFSKVVT